MSGYVDRVKHHVGFIKSLGAIQNLRNGMKIVDANKDGKISFDEIRTYENRYMHSLSSRDFDDCVSHDRSNRAIFEKRNDCLVNFSALAHIRDLKDIQNSYAESISTRIQGPISITDKLLASVAGRIELGKVNRYLVSEGITPFDTNYVNDFIAHIGRQRSPQR